MLKLGVIGLGDIAKKAYLPVLSSLEDVELHLYTRNQTTLSQMGDKYRFKNLHQSLDSLIKSGIKGAFVHSSTESHEEVVRELLSKNIHVYVDKPFTYDYQTSKSLVEMAECKSLILMAGFNRRYAPTYQKLKEINEPNMIIMQKNRNGLPTDVRPFVFDDFIHVIDTLRYLFPYPIEDIIVNGKKRDGKLYHVIVQFISSGATAIGIMNRDSGTVEEKLEVMSSTEKGTVNNVSELVIHKGGDQTRVSFSDWEPTLHKRGFEQIITDFIQAVQSNTSSRISGRDALLTHEICEEIVEKLSGDLGF